MLGLEANEHGNSRPSTPRSQGLVLDKKYLDRRDGCAPLRRTTTTKAKEDQSRIIREEDEDAEIERERARSLSLERSVTESLNTEQ
jgi:hypothetical protein